VSLLTCIASFFQHASESEVPTGEESSELYCFLSQSNGGEYNDQDLNTPHEPCSSDAKNRKSVMSASSQRRLSRQSSEMSSPSKDGGDMDSKSDEGYMKQGINLSNERDKQIFKLNC